MLHENLIPEKNVHTNRLCELQNLLENTTFMYLQTNLATIALTPDGNVQFAGIQMPITQGFLESLAIAIKMPLQYAYHIDYSLFAHNFLERRATFGKALTVCTVNGVATKVAPAQYRPAMTRDILGRVLATAEFCPFRSARISNHGVEIDFVSPKLTVEPMLGDVVELGIRISNSETGYRALKASLFALRVVCSNGAVMADALGTVRWNYDRRVAYSASVDKFCNDLESLRAGLPAQKAIYGQRLQRALMDIELSNLIRRIQLGLRLGSEEAGSILGLTASRRAAIQSRIRSRPSARAPEETEFSVWEIHNQITAAAKRFDFLNQSRLEELGGKMLLDVNRDVSEFSHIINHGVTLHGQRQLSAVAG